MTVTAPPIERQYLTPPHLSMIILNYLISGIWAWSTLVLVGLLLTEQGIEPWKIGLIGAIPWFFSLITTPLVPLYLNYLSPIQAFRAAAWCLFASSILFASTQNIWVWAIAYILFGTANSAISVLSDTFMATLPPPKYREKWYLSYIWILNFMIICGPLSIVYLGADTIIFKIGAIAVGFCVALSYLIKVTDKHMGENLREQRSSTLKDLPRAFRLTPIPMIICSVTGMAEGIAAKILPVQAYTFGFGEQISAFAVTIFGAGNFVSMLIIGLLIKKIPISKLITPALAALILTSLSIPLASSWWVYYCISVFALGGLSGGIFALATLDATTGISPKRGVQIMAGLSLSYTLGSIIASSLAGTATSINILWGMPIIIGASSLLALLTTLHLYKKTGKTSP